MSNTEQTIPQGVPAIPEEENRPQCLAISERGIKTAQDFASFMSLMMSDVVAGRISTAKAATASRTGSALLKVIEMQYRYGSETEQPGKRVLRLVE